MIYLKGALLLASLGLLLTGAWCLAGAVDSIWNAWAIRQRAKLAGRFPRHKLILHPDYGTPNWCPKCSPKGYEYCRCEIASNE